MEQTRVHHKGRIRQIPIYLGKFFRMFLYMDDWKVLPMAALIAGLVSMTVGKKMFLSMEGTLKGGLAMACVCIWNGCFNSIQVVCRERDIVKREHRSGMHITSYIFSHMVYQAFLCALQTVVTVSICVLTKVHFPSGGFMTPWFLLDIGITFFLITYAADMMSLTISCLARTTTAAMTIMPFILIFQLVFSSEMFGLTGASLKLTNISIAKWGIDCICAQGDYNSLPMEAAWMQLEKLQNFQVDQFAEMGEKEKLELRAGLKMAGLGDLEGVKELEEGKPMKFLVKLLEERDMKDVFCKKTAEANQIERYSKTKDNIKNCWTLLIGIALGFACLSVLILKRIDKDKR